MEIGVDCVDISQFSEEIISKKKIIKKIFTKNEIEYCEKKMHSAQHYAVRFAGKEAVIKAFACYGISITPGKIEILNQKNGIPFINLLDDHLREFSIKISLSHSKDTAIAFVVIIKN